MGWQNEYPNLFELFKASDIKHPNNYFVDMDKAQSPSAKQSYLEWESRFARLDSESRQNIIKRAASLVSLCDTSKGRYWTALFETLNEIKGYIYLQDLGYGDVRFIPTSSKKKQKTPDVHGIGLQGEALLEVKTVNLSANDISLLGTLQKGRREIPEGLKNKLITDYAIACDQLGSFPAQEPVRRICCFFTSVDFQVVLARSNKEALSEFLSSIEKDCEIYHCSGVW